MNPQIRLYSVQPEGPWHGLEGLKHMASAIVPGIYDPNLADHGLGAPTEEAYDLARRLTITQGILVGHSSGANLWGVREVGREIGQGVSDHLLRRGRPLPEHRPLRGDTAVSLLAARIPAVRRPRADAVSVLVVRLAALTS